MNSRPRPTWSWTRAVSCPKRRNEIIEAAHALLWRAWRGTNSLSPAARQSQEWSSCAFAIGTELRTVRDSPSRRFVGIEKLAYTHNRHVDAWFATKPEWHAPQIAGMHTRKARRSERKSLILWRRELESNRSSRLCRPWGSQYWRGFQGDCHSGCHFRGPRNPAYLHFSCLPAHRAPRPRTLPMTDRRPCCGRPVGPNHNPARRSQPPTPVADLESNRSGTRTPAASATPGAHHGCGNRRRSGCLRWELKLKPTKSCLCHTHLNHRMCTGKPKRSHVPTPCPRIKSDARLLRCRSYAID